MLALAQLRTVLPAALAGLLAGLSLSTLSCGPGRSDRRPEGNEVVVALESAPTHLDPRIGSSQASSRVFDLVLDGLVAKDPSGDLVPGLARAWEILEEGRRYRFRLRPGVRFHDGRRCTAEDVAWTYRTIVDGSVPSPKRAAFSDVERIEVIDPETVEFVLARPFGALLPNLTSFVGIVPRGATPEEMNERLIGTGPFRLVERSPDTLALAAHDAYWGGRPHLDRVTLREIPDATVRALELRKGSVQLVVGDLAPDVVETFRRDPSFRVVTAPSSKYSYLGINLEDPLLADRRVRRALALSIDRQRLVDTLWRGLGVVTETALPPGHWARHGGLEPMRRDLEAARRLLDEAGHPDPDGPGPRPRFELSYKTSTDETSLLQAQILQAMLAEAGVDLRIRSYEFATFYSDIKRGAFQLFSLTWTGVVDPDIYRLILHSASVPPAGANRGRYRNPDFDRLIEAGARRTRREERLPYYLEAQEILARDLPYVSLFIKLNFAIMPVALEGYRNYPSGELDSLARMRWRRGGPPGAGNAAQKEATASSSSS